MKKWLFYNAIVCFAVYWASNLILWFPWSKSAILGMTLMLTVSPIIWSIASFYCLRANPSGNIYKAALINGISFLSISVISDYLFFGIIRNAIDKLYHPTTFYGYGFVISLPFVIALFLRRQVQKNQSALKGKDFVRPIIIGLLCFGSLWAIIALDIKL